MTHEFLSRSSTDNSIMVPGVLVDSTNDTRTVSSPQWTAVVSHLLNWKHSRWTELISIPRASQQEKSLKYDAFRSWSLNEIYASLVHHPPATSSARSATGCVAHGSGFLPTTSPTRDDVDGSVHDVGPFTTIWGPLQWLKCNGTPIERRSSTSNL